MDSADKLPPLDAAGFEPTPFEIPGATGGTFRIQMLNEDAGRGVVTTVIHLPAGGRIPAHFHRAGAEMHYVLEGDLIEAGGAPLGVGSFLTHPAGAVHGPHESRGGARVLTVQTWQSHDGKFDFHIAEGEAANATPAQPRSDDGPQQQQQQQTPPPPAADGGTTETARAAQAASAERALGKGYG
jgi:quercetin dioxygenase-like cupin family protein